MAEYWDVGTWKETKTGKNFFIKLGSATQGDTGEWTIYLDALPLPGPKGGCRMSIKPQRPREDRQISSGGPREDFDSGAPF
jgi:hypothetical protein